MSSETPRRDARWALTPNPESDDRRSWLSHGLAALAISALGLAVAGSLTVTGAAETVADSRVVTTARQVPAQPKPVVDHTTSVLQQGTLSSFKKREAAASGTSRSTLRSAQVAERAAARAEDLTKTAASITRAARSESSKLRSKGLKATERAARENAVQIAEEARERAVAARLAAQQRAAAERLAAAKARIAADAAAADAAAAAEAEANAAARNESEARNNDRAAPPAPPGAAVARNSVTSTAERRPTPQRRSAPAVQRPPTSSRGGAASPVPGAVVGARFGQYGLWSRWHTGVDFRAAYGVPIRAVKSGVVLYAGNAGNWAGNHVAVKHGDGMTTMSSHMSSMSVSSGQSVQAGQVIGYVGQTGRAFGAHLHFELYPAGVRYGDVYRAVNPQPWLNANGVQTR